MICLKNVFLLMEDFVLFAYMSAFVIDFIFGFFLFDVEIVIMSSAERKS